jgi:hypothetical protein
MELASSTRGSDSVTSRASGDVETKVPLLRFGDLMTALRQIVWVEYKALMSDHLWKMLRGDATAELLVAYL